MLTLCEKTHLSVKGYIFSNNIVILKLDLYRKLLELEEVQELINEYRNTIKG